VRNQNCIDRSPGWTLHVESSCALHSRRALAGKRGARSPGQRLHLHFLREPVQHAGPHPRRRRIGGVDLARAVQERRDLPRYIAGRTVTRDYGRRAAPVVVPYILLRSFVRICLSRKYILSWNRLDYISSISCRLYFTQFLALMSFARMNVGFSVNHNDD